MSFPHPIRSRAGFTLIELLTVIAIIGILAAIIIPTVSKVRQSAQNGQCVSQLREWGRVINMYALENKGRYYTKNWSSADDSQAPGGISYRSYFTKANQETYRVRLCPSDPATAGILANSTAVKPRASYGMVRGSINGIRASLAPETASPLSRARTLSQFILMMDSMANDSYQLTADDLTPGLQTYLAPLVTPANAERHGTKFNAVFGDGSVKRVGWTTTPGDITSVFIMRSVWFQLY